MLTHTRVPILEKLRQENLQTFLKYHPTLPPPPKRIQGQDCREFAYCVLHWAPLAIESLQSITLVLNSNSIYHYWTRLSTNSQSTGLSIPRFGVTDNVPPCPISHYQDCPGYPSLACILEFWAAGTLPQTPRLCPLICILYFVCTTNINFDYTTLINEWPV